MLKKILLVAGSIGAVLGVSSAALAHDGDWDHDRGRGWGHERWERAHRYYPYYAPRPVYVVPAPRVVYTPPPPVVYSYPAAPVYAPAPVYSAPAVSIRFHLPL
jgi:hypothetical protein